MRPGEAVARLEALPLPLPLLPGGTPQPQLPNMEGAGLQPPGTEAEAKGMAERAAQLARLPTPDEAARGPLGGLTEEQRAALRQRPPAPMLVYWCGSGLWDVLASQGAAPAC
jgi:hypothetical protein